MEKRNFVTSLRTTDSANAGDELVGSAVCLFAKTAVDKSVSTPFEKKASQEDESSDTGL